MEPPRIQTSYMFDTENKRAVRHSNMLLECIKNSKQKQIQNEHNRQSNTTHNTSSVGTSSKYQKT